METRPEQETLEARLRASAPAPPPELRRQVLRRCQEMQRKKPRIAWGTRWRLSSAFLGFLLLCWFANGWVDAQNQAILSGDTGHPTRTAFSRPAAGMSQMEARGQSLFVAIRWRIHQIALLLEEKYSG